MIPARSGACPSRWTAALGCAAEQKCGDERLTCFFALMAMRIMGFDEWPRAGWGGPQATLSPAGVTLPIPRPSQPPTALCVGRGSAQRYRKLGTPVTPARSRRSSGGRGGKGLQFGRWMRLSSVLVLERIPSRLLRKL